MSSENSAEFTHPGPILRAARDELRLSIEHVAERLHLRPSVVALIESETYDDFSSDVFLKGYFRSYCRLVGLHEERMVELLERQLDAIQKEESKQKKAEVDAQAAERRMHLFKLGLVVTCILAICAASIWFLVGSSGLGFDEPQHRDKQRVDVLSADSEQANDQPNSNPLADETTGSVLTSEDPDLGSRAAKPEDVAGPAGEDDIEPINLQEKASAADLVGDASVENLDAREAQPESLADMVRLSIAFTGECWFEAYGADGLRIIAALKQDGGRFDYEGAKPIRIVLGNGSAASVQVDDQVLDISSRIRPSGRAELVIE